LSQDHDEGSNVFLQVQLLTIYYSNAYNLYLPEIMLHYYGNRQQNQLHLHLFLYPVQHSINWNSKASFYHFLGTDSLPSPLPSLKQWIQSNALITLALPVFDDLTGLMLLMPFKSVSGTCLSLLDRAITIVYNIYFLYACCFVEYLISR